MEWFRVDVAFILSAEFLALPEAPRAHWLSLAAYCSQQENGGVLKGAAKWKDREWSFSAGLRLRSVSALLDRGLLRVSDLCQEDYVLVNYDADGEQRMQNKSITNRKNAKLRWEKRATAVATADATLPVRNARTDETDETDDKNPTPALPGVVVLPPPKPRLELERVYAPYPRKEGRKKGLERLAKLVKTPADLELCIQAVELYARHCATTGQYLMHFDTWVGEWEDWAPDELGRPRNGAQALAPRNLNREEAAELERARRVVEGA